MDSNKIPSCFLTWRLSPGGKVCVSNLDVLFCCYEMMGTPLCCGIFYFLIGHSYTGLAGVENLGEKAINTCMFDLQFINQNICFHISNLPNPEKRVSGYLQQTQMHIVFPVSADQSVKRYKSLQLHRFLPEVWP